jgi:hypothetical protein
MGSNKAKYSLQCIQMKHSNSWRDEMEIMHTILYSIVLKKKAMVFSPLANYTVERSPPVSKASANFSG